jgi:hypothetical protein
MNIENLDKNLEYLIMISNNSYFIDDKYSNIIKMRFIQKFKKYCLVEFYDPKYERYTKTYLNLDLNQIYQIVETIDKSYFRADKIKKIKNEN